MSAGQDRLVCQCGRIVSEDWVNLWNFCPWCHQSPFRGYPLAEPEPDCDARLSGGRGAAQSMAWCREPADHHGPHRTSDGTRWVDAFRPVRGGPWTTHGHVIRGVTVAGPGRGPVARCGGPGLCGKCSVEASAAQNRAGVDHG